MPKLKKKTVSKSAKHEKTTSSKTDKHSKKNSTSSTGVLGRGFAQARKAKAESDARREQNKNRLFEFWVPDGEEKTIRFLTDEPINFYSHQVPSRGRYERITCPGEGCPLCANGDYARFVGAFLVVDRDTYVDKNNKEHTNQVKLAVFGTQVLSQIDRKAQKYGLTSRDYTVARDGKAYDWEQDEKSKLKPSLEKLLKDFDTKDPYAIVEANVKAPSLKSLNERFGDGDDDDDDGQEKAVSRKVKKFANL